jgi:hypothetical protein
MAVVNHHLEKHKSGLRGAISAHFNGATACKAKKVPASNGNRYLDVKADALFLASLTRLYSLFEKIVRTRNTTTSSIQTWSKKTAVPAIMTNGKVSITKRK